MGAHEPVNAAVQDLWTYTDETIVLRCNVPFHIPAGLPVTWMFAPNVSHTWFCKGGSHSQGALAGVVTAATAAVCAGASSCVSTHRMLAHVKGAHEPQADVCLLIHVCTCSIIKSQDGLG